MKYIFIFFIGFIIGGTFNALVLHSLGEDAYLIPKLIGIQCGKYDEINGKFKLINLLNDK